MVNFANIPAELKNSCRFTVWKKEKGKDGRLTKVPYNPVNGKKAMTNRPETFSGFPQAAAAYAVGGYDGIGIRVDFQGNDSDNNSGNGVNTVSSADADTDSDGIGAFDIDHCISQDGTLNSVAATALDIFSTCYVERSPSGTGLRGFFQVPAGYVYDKKKYYINNRRAGLEVYIPGATNRFVTVTGDIYRAGDVVQDMEALSRLLDTYMIRAAPERTEPITPHSYLTDEEVIERVTNSAQAEKFTALYSGKWEGMYGSPSDADMALLSILAFWCGCDTEQMDRLFRQSALMRPKWDRKQSGSTYGALTTQKAADHCLTIFDPVKHLVPPEDEFEILRDEILAEDSDVRDSDMHTGSANSADDDDDPPLSEEAKRELAIAIGLVDRNLADMKPNTNPLYSWSEMGLGRLFADYYERIARYVPERKSWYVYNGSVWKYDVGGMLVMQLAKHLVNELIRFAATIGRDSERAEYLEFITKVQSRRKRQTMVDDAQDEHFLTMTVFDQNCYLFNCINGTLNLKTMKFHSHRPEDFLTMMSGVSYDPKAVCPRWNTFVSEVMCGDEDLADFMQRSFGYTLTGDTSLECMFILYGATSRNGKGTAMETFLKIMGDYGKTSNPEMLSMKFTNNNNTGGPSEDVARLAGARFVNISEPEKRISFNAALVKRMTGNDTINARYLHENSFDFKPVFKIFINTNYLPNVSDMALFESGRLKIIPFNRHFAEEEQDKGLKNFFAQPENLSGIFNWCLEGYRKFCVRNLDPPQAVTDATGSYRRESDRIGQFIEAWLETGEAYEVRTSAVYNVYGIWCRENGFNAENARNFNQAIGTRFELKRKRPKDDPSNKNPTTMLVGCRLREDEEAIIQE